MSYPTPDNMHQAPAWDNYIVAQASLACLGLIPLNAVAVAIRVDRLNIEIVFQMLTVSPDDEEDIQDIRENLETMTGLVADVSTVVDVVARPKITPGPEYWIYRINDVRSDPNWNPHE